MSQDGDQEANNSERTEPSGNPSYFDKDVQEAEFGEANRPEELENPAKATGDNRQALLDHPEPRDEEESLHEVNRPQRYQEDFVETPEGLARPDTLGRLRPLRNRDPHSRDRADELPGEDRDS